MRRVTPGLGLLIVLLGAAIHAACGKTSRRESITDLRPALSTIRNDLVALAPNLPDVGKVGEASVPEGVLEIDGSDATRDNTIIIGLPALRDPYDLKKDDLLEVGFAFRHRYLDCLRDVADGSTSGAQEAAAGYRAGCERALAARYALVYRVASHRPARFELPTGGELRFEPGAISVEWFIIDLGPPSARSATLVGSLLTSAKTPDSLTISFDKGTEPGLVDARRQAAEGLARSILDELMKSLIGKAKHVAL